MARVPNQEDCEVIAASGEPLLLSKPAHIAKSTLRPCFML